MKVFFDTSVLIASFINAHPRHIACLPWLQKVKNREIEGVISVHSLVESYSVLTTLPLSPRIYPSLAKDLIIENIISCFDIIEYRSTDYKKLLNDLALKEISGGTSYDGLILVAAQKVKIDKILTLNVDDFIRIAPELLRLISQP